MDNYGTIYYTTSGMLIYPYTEGQSTELEKMTSYYDRVYHKRLPFNGYCIYGSFITYQIPEDTIRRLLPTYDIKYMPVNKFDKLPPLKMDDEVDMTDIQSDIITKTLSSGNNRVFIDLQTGFGKTLISVSLIVTALSVKTFVMCYRTKVLDQWVKTFTRFTNIPIEKIKIISSGKQIDKILTGNMDEFKDAYIVLSTPAILTSYAKRHNSIDVINEVYKKLGIGLKIWDEAHRQVANITKIDGCTSVAKTIYLSADFNQVDRYKRYMYFNMFSNVTKITPDKEAMDNLKYISAIVIDYNTKPSVMDEANIKGRYGFSMHNFVRYSLGSQVFNDSIVRLITTIQKTPLAGKIVLFTSLIESVDTIYEMLLDKFGKDFTIGRYHSGISSEEKEYTEKECNLIVTTYQSFSVGIDIDNIQHVVTLDPIDEISDNQAAGRARPPRNGKQYDCFYYIFNDKGFSYCNYKLKNRLKYLENKKVKRIYKIKY